MSDVPKITIAMADVAEAVATNILQRLELEHPSHADAAALIAATADLVEAVSDYQHGCR